MHRRGRSNNSGQMPAVSLAILLVMAFVLQPATGEPDVNLPSVMEETLAAVRACMERNPAPWPQEWQREYVDTIREAIDARQDAPQRAKRLEILAEGFEPYWVGLAKDNKERSHFDVCRVQVRWYVENLMSAGLPGEEEIYTLRYQYEELASHAAKTLLAQFPFLDPNLVQEVKANYLADCYRDIDAPLLPVFLAPFSLGQLDEIRQRWDDLRYSRVRLYRQLETSQLASRKNEHAKSPHSHLDYVLVERGLSQLRTNIWSVVVSWPDYYRIAVKDLVALQGQRLDAISRARKQESSQDSRMLQTECMAFLLTSLLETMVLDGSPSGQIKPQEGANLSDFKGGDVHDLKKE